MKRRTFLQKAMIGTAGMITAGYYPAFAQQNKKMNNIKKIKVGLIGAGWYGMVITEAALKTGNVEVIAVCDVDSKNLKDSADKLEQLQGTRPKEFVDHQKMLVVKGLDAIFIGSVPHWHALHFVDACNKGLDIYCEKPLSYDIEEGKAMVSATIKAGNIVQIGFQRRQSKAFVRAKELIQNNAIGKVHQIKAQIHYNASIGDNTIQSPPSSLDWERWCGPAPKLDYRPSIGHMSWRLEKEYGNGHLVDWGIHHIDIIRYIMNFQMPNSIVANGGIEVLKDKISTPDTLNVVMNFDNCPVVWEHRLWGTGDMNAEYNNGIFFYGDSGTLFASDEKLILKIKGSNEYKIIDLPNPTAQDEHVANFVEAVKTKNKEMLSCTIEDAFLSTATVQLAMVSYYTNSKVEWDSDNMTIVNNHEAKKLLARPYRTGYKRPQI